ncbi:nucleotide-binding alpha-beta plait domain-containing protein [Tanacetum coccineum]
MVSDPEVLDQVKSVFVDGLPPHWDEDIVRENLKSYGTFERVMLARNMSSSKRYDFGFIDFTTHEAAVTCINGKNTRSYLEVYFYF